MRTGLLVAVLLLAACHNPSAADPSEDACGATAVQGLVGAPVAEAHGLSAPGPVRVIRPNQPVDGLLR
jgi:hypothetical protein